MPCLGKSKSWTCLVQQNAGLEQLGSYSKIEWKLNTREGEKLFKLKDIVGTGTDGDKLVVNKFRLESGRCF